MSRWIGIWVMFAVLSVSCESTDSEPFFFFSQVYDFSNSSFDWEGDFADYPVGDSAAYNLTFAYTELPGNLGSGNSLMLSGDNQCDDLFMFLKKKVTNLNRNTEYTISFAIKFATNTARDIGGAGGSPGESIYLKAGAFHEEPMKIVKDGYYIMNLDKGNQSSKGENMIVLGTTAATDANGVDYSFETLSNFAPFKARTDQNGQLWIIVGTDSDFEGLNTLYYTQISVVLTASE